MEQLDEWNQVNSELNKSCEDRKPRFVLFVEKWNPFSLHAARIFRKIKAESSEQDIFIVDADKLFSIASGFGIIGTPALIVFFRGMPVKIKRRGWEEDVKYVGVTSESNYYNIVHMGREQAITGNPLICD
ncbi:unnamed protein product [Blepharisma stoltei]|uniref:Uncharacterized protein n=1 Tax=Blepharisma stoltei TaxID=1481888 RepID=A0AAU9J8F8_9CILI|nr:unnamed protein product [Blepharisma stoltei]